MRDTVTHLKSALPPLGAGLVGWPLWAVGVLVLISYGPAWTMAWLDVIDRLRERESPDGGDSPCRRCVISADHTALPRQQPRPPAEARTRRAPRCSATATAWSPHTMRRMVVPPRPITLDVWHRLIEHDVVGTVELIDGVAWCGSYRLSFSDEQVAAAGELGIDLRADRDNGGLTDG